MQNENMKNGLLMYLILKNQKNMVGSERFADSLSG
jgi:hypothetical protein